MVSVTMAELAKVMATPLLSVLCWGSVGSSSYRPRRFRVSKP